MKYQIQQMNEMISASISHPSVIFWGFFNEGPSNNAAACPGYQVGSYTSIYMCVCVCVCVCVYVYVCV